MSTAHVVNTGMVNAASRSPYLRASGATGFQTVDPLEGSNPAPARDQYMRFEDEPDDFDYRGKRRYGQFQDRVVSYGGVLVSREVGATIMQAQQAASANTNALLPADAERSIAVYEFNQALMGSAEAVTSIGMRR